MHQEDDVGHEFDKRQSRRRRVLKGAKIVFNNGSSTISCVVRDQSETGIRLKVDLTLGIPDKFDLQIATGAFRPCQVAWKANREFGVASV